MYLIAVDLGAGSGRVALGRLDTAPEAGASTAGLAFEVVHRFANAPVPVEGRLYWDVLGLWREILTGLERAAERLPEGASVASVGVDSWAVDYALLGPGGHLLDGVRAYRDPRTEGTMERAFERLPRDEIYRRTGIQFLPIDTLYQLLAHEHEAPGSLERAERFLLLPDLLHLWLSGVAASERSNASTTQLVDPATGDWAEDVLAAFDLPRRIFPEIRAPGTVLGAVREDVADATGLHGAQVVLPATHDTGSAVAAVPAKGDDWAYISSGTWSLVGIETPEPVRSDAAREAGLTNELGVGGTVRLLRNVMGLWILEECRRVWDVPIEALLEGVTDAHAHAAYVDPDDSRFLAPGRDMPERVQAYCRETGQVVPEGSAAIARCVLESLALAYARALDGIERVSGRTIRTVHVVGGGSQNELLSQWTADAAGRPVVCGPVEATLLGNLLIQAVGLGVLDLEDVRPRVIAATETTRYEPRESGAWSEARQRFDVLVDHRGPPV